MFSPDRPIGLLLPNGEKVQTSMGRHFLFSQSTSAPGSFLPSPSDLPNCKRFASMTRRFLATEEKVGQLDRRIRLCLSEVTPWLLEVCRVFVWEAQKVVVPILDGSVESISSLG